MYIQLMNTETPLQINDFMTIVMHYDGRDIISLPSIIVNLEGGSAEPSVYGPAYKPELLVHAVSELV